MNILFASIEDLNDWIEPLGGHPQVRTPNLSRLAKMGMLFHNAYAPVPACSPSRTAALFGQNPWETGVYSNTEKWHYHYPSGQRLSLVGAMKNAGYTTVGAGKIFHLDVKGYDPADWDDYKSDIRHRKYPIVSKVVAAGKLGRLTDFGPDPEDRADFDAVNTDWICDRIQPGLDHQFWGFGLYRPHLPFIVPKEYFDMYPGEIAPPPGLGQPTFRPGNSKLIDDLPEEAQKFIGRWTGWALHKFGEYNDFLRAYLASITYADTLLGKVLDRLEETGQMDNTLIVLWSDHGWQLGEKLTFRKFSLWERALRVPLMVAGPGVVRGDGHEPVSLLDIYPTLMSLTGARAAHRLDGEDFSPVLRGEHWERKKPVVSVWGTWGSPEDGRIAFSLRSKTHRYTLYWNGGEEMYDSEADPFEHVNLLANGAGDNLRGLANHYQSIMNAAIGDIVPPAAEPDA